jgi:hypothetical protein
VSAGAVVVQVPWPTSAGPLRVRVGVGDRWGIPGQRLAAPPGLTMVTLTFQLTTANLWLEATSRFPVSVAPEGTTVVRLAWWVWGGRQGQSRTLPLGG